MDGSNFKVPDDLLFCTDKGTPLDEKNLMRRTIKPIAEKLGMSWSWHVFRHTHSALAEDLGMALSDRQAQMGHGDYHMTMHYTHSDLNRRRRTLDEMADRLVGHPSENGVEAKLDADLTLNDTRLHDAMSASYGFYGRPGWTRTSDPLLRRQVLYPPELRAHRARVYPPPS